MTFPPANDLQPIIIDSPNALVQGQSIPQTVPGITYGITCENRIDATTGNVSIVTVLDQNGNPVPIGDFILALINRQVGGILVNFSNAPIDPACLITLPDIPEAYRDAFARFFLSVQGGNGNAKLLVNGFSTYTESEFNSNYKLSEGNDAVLTTALNNVIYGEGGDDAFVVEAYASNPGTSTTSYFSLGEGKDEVSITKAALKQNKSKIVIESFNSKEDTIALDTKEKRVQGIDTKKLKITTKNSKFKIKTFDDTIFTKDSIDFI